MTTSPRDRRSPSSPGRTAVWTEVAARNLAFHSPRLQRDEIVTELSYSQRVVTVRRRERSLLMIATDYGWVSSPANDNLRLPLDRTVALERRLHRLLVEGD
ncbi:hypothetical protein J4H86_26220 [Spiractinospora alimapuensis]|uniref:hypothetical protein n=1 Tax=Spiractinospora alimapuensis TaxID=2820884 RepID=UPI001F18399E|nr:hypothetical protein [Spiractinospora alimapuensis]QVQ52154.1 hypothetical protein J4H86_26220 [Spiractinospora alimapuensis]